MRSHFNGLLNDGVFLREKVMRPLMARYHLTSLQLKLANNRPYIDHMDELENEITKVKEDDKYSYAANEATRMIERVAADEKELAELRIADSQSTFGKWFSYLTPFLLAPALALRITKVTAESYAKLKSE